MLKHESTIEPNLNGPQANGIVYALTNKAFPELVKIGHTTSSLEDRLRSLYSTNLPSPFICRFAIEVENPDRVEKALHMALANDRHNPKREFFKVDVENLIPLMKILGRDVTPSIKTDDAKVEADAQLRLRRKQRPRFTFDALGIPVGAEIVSTRTGECATVTEGNNVIFRGEDMPLSRANDLVVNRNYNVEPLPYWTYNGRVLKDIYNEVYPRDLDVDDDVRVAKPNKRPRMDFFDLGLDVGDILEFKRDRSITAKVATYIKVEYEDEVMSLSELTTKLLRASSGMQGSPYWWSVKHDRLLIDIYNEIHPIE